jgi:hypothetical protein
MLELECAVEADCYSLDECVNVQFLQHSVSTEEITKRLHNHYG